MPSKSALIVASAAYQDPGLRRLVAPTHDALALAEVLADSRIGGFDVKSLVDRPSHEVRAAIEDLFADRKRDDVVLLYFSGHGVKDEDGQLYFATVDTQLNRGLLRRATAVEDRFVNDAMRRCLSRRQVLLLDCCYSGAFASGMLAKGAAGVDTKERFDGRGRIVLTASDAMQYSFESDGVQGEAESSYFTSALVRGLASGEADLDRDGLFSVDEVYEYVHDRLADEAPQQRPMKIGFVEGKFFLAQNPHFEAPELPAELVGAIGSGWVQTRLGAVAELERLVRGPNRALAAVAERALRALVDDDSREVARAASLALGPAAGPSPVAAAARAADAAAAPKPAPPVGSRPAPAVGSLAPAAAPAPKPLPPTARPASAASAPSARLPATLPPPASAATRPARQPRRLLRTLLLVGAVSIPLGGLLLVMLGIYGAGLVQGTSQRWSAPTVSPTGPAPAVDAKRAAPAPSKVDAATTDVEAARQVVAQFVNATAAGNYKQAYDLYANGNKAVQPPAAFEQIALNYAPRFRVAAMNLGFERPAPGTIHFMGTFTLDSGAVLPATFQVMFEDGEWRIGPWQIGY